MDGISKGLGTLKYVFVTIILLLIFMMIYFVSNDYEDKFVITINGKEITSRYDQEYVKYFLKRFGDSNYNKTVSDESQLFNKVSFANNYILEIKEYEVYNKFGHRENYYMDKEGLEYKEVFDEDKTMMVQKDGKIIYEGKFLSNLKDIIKMPGRYYFHVYTKQDRATSPFAYSKTSLHFCFLVGDYYE